MNDNNIAAVKPLKPEGTEGNGAAVIPPDAIGEVITALMRPVIQGVIRMLENNTAALEQLSAAQSVQNDRLEALEKQIRLQTPVTGKQVTYLNDSIRARSRELLDKRGIEDPKAVRKLGNTIRKAVLSRYGLSGLRELPRHEYGVAMSQISMWNDMIAIRDLTKEFREQEEGKYKNEKDLHNIC